MVEVDWDSRARRGVGLQSVIDPGDRTGLKNGLIDRIQWGQIGAWAGTRHSVLDYGCGIGRFAQRLVRLGVKYTGVDTSAAMIESARQLHPGGTATFHHAELPLPFDAASFDGCLSVGVLQCLKAADGVQLRGAVAELARVLSADGELLLIEQASASGGVSGSVAQSSTEQDYIDALTDRFRIGRVQRIRCGSLSRLSALYVRWGGLLPLRGPIEGFLAKREASIAGHADAGHLRSLVYYDVAIHAVKR